VRRRDWELIGIFLFIIWSGSVVYGQDAAEYIILQDIGQYQFITETSDFITGEPKTIPGYIKFKGPGLIAAAGHFYEDHQDITFETNYVKLGVMSVSVQVTRHAGVDSDQWLLHEVEYSYRDPEDNTLGLAIQGVRIRNFNGDNIIALRGNSYSWISNNTVIIISYTDLDGTKPEPLEVVQAYLQKYPSTLPEGFVFDAAHNEQWIKDEMSRRLWLSEKWFAWQAGGNVEMVEALGEVVDHLEEFLDYRQRYFGMNADQEKMDLIAAKRVNGDVAIKAKLTQYKQWWEGHKGDSITLP
jgi:hypothetical protein